MCIFVQPSRKIILLVCFQRLFDFVWLPRSLHTAIARIGLGLAEAGAGSSCPGLRVGHAAAAPAPTGLCTHVTSLTATKFQYTI